MIQKIFSGKILGVLLAAIVSLLWGTLFPTIKIGYRVFGIDSTQIASILLFAGIRFLICGILLVSADSIRHKGIRLPGKGSLKAVILVGMLTVVIHYALTYTGLSFAEGSKSSVLKQIAFLIVPGIAFLFRKEDTFSLRKIFAACLGFLAVLSVSLDGESFTLGLGELLIIAASFSSMFGQIASKNAYDTYEPAYIVAYSQLFGGILLVVVGLLFGGQVGTVSAESMGVLAYICFASITANLLWNTLIKYNDMTRLSVLKSMDPLFASVFSAFLLGENICRPTYLLAVALIVFAITVSNYAPQKGGAGK